MVWDDARLIDSDYKKGQGLRRAKKLPDECPPWFEKGRNSCLEWRYNITKTNGNTIPEGVMRLADCWQHYRKLLQGQNAVLDDGSDVEAFKYGLSRFPALKRVTLTPAAHGNWDKLYETPMLRALPDTFAYPLPRGWPGGEQTVSVPDVQPWSHQLEYKFRRDFTIDEDRDFWRGFWLIMRALAQSEHKMTEFVIATHHHHTGMNCFGFDEPCQEYRDFAALLSRPGFRRLDLALSTSGLETEMWHPFRNKFFIDALAGATDLEHFSISSDMDIDVIGCPAQVEDLENPDADEAFRCWWRCQWRNGHVYSILASRDFLYSLRSF